MKHLNRWLLVGGLVFGLAMIAPSMTRVDDGLVSVAHAKKKKRKPKKRKRRPVVKVEKCSCLCRPGTVCRTATGEFPCTDLRNDPRHKCTATTAPK